MYDYDDDDYEVERYLDGDHEPVYGVTNRFDLLGDDELGYRDFDEMDYDSDNYMD